MAKGACRPPKAMLGARLTRPVGIAPVRQSGRSSGVEHNLAKVGVEGSNPFARSSFPKENQRISGLRAALSLETALSVMPVVSIMSPENNRDWATSGVGWRRLRPMPCSAQPLFCPVQATHRLATAPSAGDNRGDVETARALVAVRLSDSTRFERPLICGEERQQNGHSRRKQGSSKPPQVHDLTVPQRPELAARINESAVRSPWAWIRYAPARPPERQRPRDIARWSAGPHA